MSLVDFLKSKSRRCIRTKFKFRGGYIVNRRTFNLYDTFMELTHSGEGYIFYVELDHVHDQLCIRLLWTCPDVHEEQWTRSESIGKNKEFVDKNIQFVYMLNLDKRNERYKFSEPFALWLRQRANPYKLEKFFCSTCTVECQTDPEQEPDRGSAIVSPSVDREKKVLKRKRSRSIEVALFADYVTTEN